MKKTLTLALGVAAALTASAAVTVSHQDPVHGMDLSGVCEIDVNGDGYLDYILSGRMGQGTSGRIITDAEGNESQIEGNTWLAVWNNSTKTYEFSQFPFFFANRAIFCVNDWNGDGVTDFFVTGEASQTLHNVETGMFLGRGDGTFERTKITVLDSEGNEIPAFDPRSCDFADFNSDGLLDIVTVGWKDVNGTRMHGNAVLLNKGNLTFEMTNTDVCIYGNNPVEFALCTVKAADLNNDGYAEFLAQGNVDNADDVDKPEKNGKRHGRTFITTLNLGAENDVTTLYNLDLASGVSHHFGHGDIQVADFNNDGVPDIIVGGESPEDGRPSGWNYAWQLLLGKINADGVSYTDATASTPLGQMTTRPLNEGRQTAAIDFNGNGLVDFILPGWNEIQPDNSGMAQTGWFMPNNKGAFTSYERIPGASETSVWFLEHGVRGVRNMAFTGYSNDPTYFGPNHPDFAYEGRQLVYCNNPYTKAPRPAAPAAVNAKFENGILSIDWTAAADAQPNTTYDYYIKDLATGKYYRGIASHVGGELDGVRTCVAQGRAFQVKKVALKDVPEGKYEIGVQAVNAALEGSTFTTATVGEASVGSVVADAKVVATEYYNAAGVRIAAPVKGFCITKEIRADGSTRVSKSVR